MLIWEHLCRAIGYFDPKAGTWSLTLPARWPGRRSSSVVFGFHQLVLGARSRSHCSRSALRGRRPAARTRVRVEANEVSVVVRHGGWRARTGDRARALARRCAELPDGVVACRA